MTTIKVGPEYREAPRKRGAKKGHSPALALAQAILDIEKRTGKTCREAVLQALREGGSERGAAGRLGISERLLKRLMDLIGVEVTYRAEFTLRSA